jgi:hypothetical protein
MVWMRNTYKILIVKPKGTEQLGELDIDGRILLKRILKEWDLNVRNEINSLRK